MRRDVLRIPAELQDVALRQARMFEQFPARIWRSRRSHTALIRRKSLQGRLPIYVGLTLGQKISQVFAENCVVQWKTPLNRLLLF